METTAIDTSGVEPERFLNTKEAAKFLRLSPRTLEGYRRTGEGPPFHKLNKGKQARVVYLLSDLKEYAHARRYDSTSQYDIN